VRRGARRRPPRSRHLAADETVEATLAGPIPRAPAPSIPRTASARRSLGGRQPQAVERAIDPSHHSSSRRACGRVAVGRVGVVAPSLRLLDGPRRQTVTVASGPRRSASTKKSNTAPAERGLVPGRTAARRAHPPAAAGTHPRTPVTNVTTGGRRRPLRPGRGPVQIPPPRVGGRGISRRNPPARPPGVWLKSRRRRAGERRNDAPGADGRRPWGVVQISPQGANWRPRVSDPALSGARPAAVGGRCATGAAAGGGGRTTARTPTPGTSAGLRRSRRRPCSGRGRPGSGGGGCGGPSGGPPSCAPRFHRSFDAPSMRPEQVGGIAPRADVRQTAASDLRPLDNTPTILGNN
jgi:hypothetical protein